MSLAERGAMPRRNIIACLFLLAAACGETMPAGPDAGNCVGEGTTCTLDDGTAGLCMAGFCATCINVDDDAACADAYGPGNLCVENQCQLAECHVSDDLCGGEVCVDHQCVGCTGNGQCDTEGDVCDQQTGEC